MQETKVKTKAIDKGNRAVARPGGKEAGVEATTSAQASVASPRTETGYEAGDADEWPPRGPGVNGTGKGAFHRCSLLQPGLLNKRPVSRHGDTELSGFGFLTTTTSQIPSKSRVVIALERLL